MNALADYSDDDLIAEIIRRRDRLSAIVEDARHKHPAIGRAISAVEQSFGIAANEIFTLGRREPVASARRVAMALLLNNGMAHGEVGRIFGRDRSTVQWASRTVAKEVQTDKRVARAFTLFSAT